MRHRLILLAIPLAVVAAVGTTTVASAAPPGLSSTILTGPNEVPGPGDDDGIGRAFVLPQPGQARVCTDTRYRGIDTPTGAHIHEGATTVAGPIVIDFTPLIAISAPGQIRGCVAVDPALARDVAQNPGDYYVNVHNVPFPAGAIRGQLAPAS